MRVLRNPFRQLYQIAFALFCKCRFKEYHRDCSIMSMSMLTPKYISLGHCVYIGKYGRIEGVSEWLGTQYNPLIVLQDNVSIQQNVHITCANKIVIGKNSAIAAGVTITDINHSYIDITRPVEQQEIEVKDVIVGEDCKIYNGAVILPGVHIGNHCVVGANSVVNRDVPDYSVVAGSPARIIKQFDFEKKIWIKTN